MPSVRVTPRVLDILATHTPKLSIAFKDRRGPTQLRLGIGDIVGVQLFEAGAGGLFIPLDAGAQAGNFINLSNQAVDNNGNISVPYAGNIRAQGRTQDEVQKAIVDALKGSRPGAAGPRHARRAAFLLDQRPWRRGGFRSLSCERERRTHPRRDHACGPEGHTAFRSLGHVGARPPKGDYSVRRARL